MDCLDQGPFAVLLSVFFCLTDKCLRFRFFYERFPLIPMTSGHSETFARNCYSEDTLYSGESICHCQSGIETLSSFTDIQGNLDLSISICGLNTSLPSCLHPKPIEPVFYRCSITKSLFKRSFKLRCFQFLSRAT